MKNALRCSKILVLSIFFLVFGTTAFAQKYKDMMQDPSINFYTVVEEANTYFAKNGKGKGSGWKQFERWAADNEYKYYPDGDRSLEDPFFVAKAYEDVKQSAPKSLFPNGWEELGPWETGTITGHYAHGLGRILTHYIAPGNDQIMYLGSGCAGFWKTTDGGASWIVSTDYLEATGVNTITAKPNNINEVLINVRNSQNSNTHGIYRSLDGGETWSLSAFNPSNLGWGGLGDNSKIYKVVYHPTIANKVYVGTSRGLFISTDNLQSWTQVLSSTFITDIEFHPTDPNIVYVYDDYYWGSNQDVILVSTNGGSTFSASNTLTGNDENTLHLTVSPVCPNCVYAASTNGIWKSTNSGVTFSFISNPEESRIGGFAVSDLNDNNILYGYVDAMMSTNGGATFDQVTYWSLGNTNGAGNGHQQSFLTSTDYIHADLQYATCHNGVFYGVTDGFLVKSTDNGISWEQLNEGTGIRMNYNLGVSQSNQARTICGSQDNGTSIKVEGDWIEFTGGDGMEGIIHPLNDDWMISSYQYGSHRVTKDGGYSSSSGTAPNSEGYWISPMVYDPNEHMRVYQFSDTIHRSDDFAETWTVIGEPNFSGDIQFATIAENNSNLLVVCRYEFIELSTDGGQTFTSIKGNLPDYSITDVVFDPNDDNTIVVTYGRHQNDNSKVYITHNQGATWTNITYNLGNMPVRCAVIDHTDASTIYLGTEIGVYKKAMNENTWVLYNDYLPNVAVREMEIMWGSNTLRATTWGRGLWEYTLDGRADYPAIVSTRITDMPTFDTPKATVEQYVTANIEYDNALTDVYLEWSVGAPTFGNVISMSNTSGNEWVSDQPIPDQPVGTKVFFKVFAEGSSNDVSETYKFMYTVHEFEFCQTSGSSDNGNLYFHQVDLAGVVNNSGNDAYTYYANSVVNLNPGGTYNISLNANTGWTDNDMGAWIDYDDDASFEASEMILDAPNTGGFATNSFTVPTDAVAGDTIIMRLRLGYWDNPVLDPCGTTLGEVEDYPVIISPTTGIEQQEKATLSAYAANGNLYIACLGCEQDASIELLDMSGRVVLTAQRSKLNDTQTAIPIQHLSIGVYVLRVATSTQVLSQKIFTD